MFNVNNTFIGHVFRDQRKKSHMHMLVEIVGLHLSGSEEFERFQEGLGELLEKYSSNNVSYKPVLPDLPVTVWNPELTKIQQVLKYMHENGCLLTEAKSMVDFAQIQFCRKDDCT